MLAGVRDDRPTNGNRPGVTAAHQVAFNQQGLRFISTDVVAITTTSKLYFS